jgi:hypothetical protein
METKLIFDATKPLPPYEFPREAKAPAEIMKQIDLQQYVRAFEPAKDYETITA